MATLALSKLTHRERFHKIDAIVARMLECQADGTPVPQAVSKAWRGPKPNRAVLSGGPNLHQPGPTSNQCSTTRAEVNWGKPESAASQFDERLWLRGTLAKPAARSVLFV